MQPTHHIDLFGDLTLAGQLFRGEVAEVVGDVLDAHSRAVTPHLLTPEQLLVRGDDTYFVDVISSIEAALAI